MANYPVPENPTYDANIRALEATDQVRNTVVNPLIEKLISNTHAVKKSADANATAITGKVDKETGKALLANTDKATYDGYAAQIASKQAAITGGATTIATANLTASRALVSDANGKVAASAATAVELGHVSGVTSAIQTQMNAKAPLASPALSGTPTAPTAAVATNNTQIATTAFVKNQGYATAADLPVEFKGTTAGAATAYTITVDSSFALADGINVTAKLHVANGANFTLNVNSKGTKVVYYPDGSRPVAGDYAAGSYVSLVYNGTYFFVLGANAPKLTGNATAGDILSGKTAYITDPKAKVTGTLALSGTATAADVAAGKTFYGTDAKTKLTGTNTLANAFSKYVYGTSTGSGFGWFPEIGVPKLLLYATVLKAAANPFEVSNYNQLLLYNTIRAVPIESGSEYGFNIVFYPVMSTSAYIVYRKSDGYLYFPTTPSLGDYKCCIGLFG